MTALRVRSTEAHFITCTGCGSSNSIDNARCWKCRRIVVWMENGDVLFVAWEDGLAGPRRAG